MIIDPNLDQMDTANGMKFLIFVFFCLKYIKI